MENEVVMVTIKKAYAAQVLADLALMEAVELETMADQPIPQWQQDEVLRIADELEKNPEKGIGWEEAMRRIAAL